LNTIACVSSKTIPHCVHQLLDIMRTPAYFEDNMLWFRRRTQFVRRPSDTPRFQSPDINLADNDEDDEDDDGSTESKTPTIVNGGELCCVCLEPISHGKALVVKPHPKCKACCIYCCRGPRSLLFHVRLPRTDRVPL